VGNMMAAGAADLSVGHGSLHIIEGAGGRHLLTGPASSTGDEKMSDAALSTQAAILKAVNTGRCVALLQAWQYSVCCSPWALQCSTACARLLHLQLSATVIGVNTFLGGNHGAAVATLASVPPTTIISHLPGLDLQQAQTTRSLCRAFMLASGRATLQGKEQQNALGYCIISWLVHVATVAEHTAHVCCVCSSVQCQQGDNSWHPHDGGCHRSLYDTC